MGNILRFWLWWMDDVVNCNRNDEKMDEGYFYGENVHSFACAIQKHGVSKVQMRARIEALTVFTLMMTATAIGTILPDCYALIKKPFLPLTNPPVLESPE